MHFDASSNALDVQRSIPIEKTAELGRNVTIVELRPRDVRSPHALGCNTDDRNLALFVRDVWLSTD
jgi:hypothetical protein